jgi:hypothetical protein
MEFIKIFIIVQVLFLLLQFIGPFKLQSYQYCELVFGSFFIILFFGLFGSILLIDPTLINNSALFSVIFSIWYYITMKITNQINSDSNGVIYY